MWRQTQGKRPQGDLEMSEEETRQPEAETAAPAPDPTPPPAAKGKDKAKPARRGAGWLPTLVVIVFAVATVVFYLEWTATRVELNQSRRSGHLAAASVLGQASTELATTKQKIASRDFGDAQQCLNRARLLLDAARVSATDEASVDILTRTKSALKEAADATAAMSEEAAAKADVVVDLLKGSQQALTSAWVGDMKRDLTLARYYGKVKRSMEEAVSVFESSKVGDVSEETLKEVDKLKKKLENKVSEGVAKNVK
jgi:hypothetical protein